LQYRAGILPARFPLPPVAHTSFDVQALLNIFDYSMPNTTRGITCAWRLAITLLLLVYTFQSIAQQPYYKKYTQNEGFASNIVYNIVQDKQHFLWFSTENGVCRFDGRNVKHFTPSNSGFDLGVFSLCNDNDNRTWAISIFSPPVYYFNNRFYSLPKAVKASAHNTRWMLNDSKGYIYFLTREGNIVRWKEGEEQKILHVADVALSGGAMINDTMMVVSGLADIYTVSKFNTVSKLDIKGYTHEPNRLYKMRNNLVIGYASDGIYQFAPTGYKMVRKHTDLFSSISYSMHVENDSTIWLATRDGVYMYRYSNSQFHFINQLLPGKCVLAIHKDHSGNYWFAVANEAIYFLNAITNRYYSFPGRQTNINHISFTGNTGHVFTNNGDHYLLQHDSLGYAGNMIDKTPTYTYLKSIKTSDSAILVLYRGGPIAIVKNNKLQMQAGTPYLPANNFYYRNDGKFFRALNDYKQIIVWQVADTGAREVERIPASLSTIDITKQFCFDYYNRCWCSLADTLVCIERNSAGKGIINKYPTHGIFIADIRCDADSNVWVATKGAGVFCIGNRRIIKAFTTAQGLATNFCTSLYIDDDNNVWVCSQSGLNKIYKDKNGIHIKAFTKNNLLPVAGVNCVYKKGNNIYAGTTDGLFVFEDTTNQLGANPVNCYISNVSVDGKAVRIQNNYTLPYGQPINIGFSTIDYNQSSPPVFHYRLHDADHEWNTTTTGQIQYGQLKPGQYTFTVYSGRYPSQSISLSLYVLSPFWLQWWFILCMVILLLLVAFTASYIVVRVKHRKAELARRILENDLKSLRAQINPHFIFNALNSIQDFILDQQPRTANRYLTRFARLMRMIIDNSAKEWINIGAEITFLQHYLDLEKLRLGESFHFNIITDAAIDADLLHIPPMLIQPLVENSVKHGLAGKDGHKHLEIHFSMQKNMVYCRVKDNGVGREHARAVAAKNIPRRSMGIENISERLQLLSANQYHAKEPVVITDLYDGAVPCGTLVEIWIPYFIDN
jgi:hypothetical protein